METRPEMRKYRCLASAIVVTVFAGLAMTAGVLILLAGLVGRNTGSYIYVGLGCIMSAALMFIISNIAEDTHYKRYLEEYYGEETVNYHYWAMNEMKTIEELLRHRQPSPGDKYVMPSLNWNCPRCGEENAADAIFCKNCGTQIQE